MVALGGMHGCSGGVVALGGVHGCLGGMRGCLGVCGCSGGVCMVAPGGHAWFFPGGVHGFFWGHAWFFPGGMSGFFRGACVGYDEIQLMSGQYASYWNAFFGSGSQFWALLIPEKRNKTKIPFTSTVFPLSPCAENDGCFPWVFHGHSYEFFLCKERQFLYTLYSYF